MKKQPFYISPTEAKTFSHLSLGLRITMWVCVIFLFTSLAVFLGHGLPGEKSQLSVQTGVSITSTATPPVIVVSNPIPISGGKDKLLPADPFAGK